MSLLMVRWAAAAALLLCAPVALWAHSETRIAVVLDTDMALDDIRAIALLSQCESVDLLAAVSSDGACDPADGAAILRRALAYLGRAEVPVAAGRTLDAPAPPWRALTQNMNWPDGATELPVALAPSAPALLAEALANRDGVIYLCLGPLSNLADLLNGDPAATAGIAAVHYWGTSPGAGEASWNTARDLPAARRVFASPLRVHGLQMPDEQLLRYDAALAAEICAEQGPAPRLLCALHESPRAAAMVGAGHFRCWDETAVLELLFPELFDWKSAGGAAGLARTFDTVEGRRRYLDLLSGELSMRHGHREAVALSAFPTAADGLRADVAAIAEATLARHGTEEWNCVLLTCELHRHLGIYSILGAKMGLYARELLDAGMDELRVVSQAGDEPPLSCLTDGLQVGTGATLGRGAITAPPGGGKAAARFSKGDRALELSLKPEVLARIRADIRSCIDAHGDLTPAYWAAVRALALRYWLEMDRAAICDVAWRDR